MGRIYYRGGLEVSQGVRLYNSQRDRKPDLHFRQLLYNFLSFPERHLSAQVADGPILIDSCRKENGMFSFFTGNPLPIH